MCTHNDIVYRVSNIQIRTTSEGDLANYFVEQCCGDCDASVRVQTIEMKIYDIDIIKFYHEQAVKFYV